MTDYALDGALRDVVERLRKLELSVARNKPASGVTVGDSGGLYGSPGTLTAEEIFALLGGPGAFLTVIAGGGGTVNPMGTLGATQIVDLALGNKHLGTLAEDCTLTTVGWSPAKDRIIAVKLTEDGTGGWTPTFTGITWKTPGGLPPTHDTTAGTTTTYVFSSDDGGTVIEGSVWGGGGSSEGGGQTPYLIENGETFTVPIKKQALKAMPITIDSGGSLVVDGFLLEVA